ncbi:MAG: sporulation protein [Mariprofundaceae bacterium]|nr:sporulation protein [Mariprofundaceae bacterium]
MSWIDNILSRFGIGGARVHTILEDRPFIAGEKIMADIMVHGGRHAQLIEGLHFVFYCSYEKTEFIDREYNEDDDYLEIKATPVVENICVALTDIGFVLKESQCEATQINFGS